MLRNDYSLKLNAIKIELSFFFQAEDCIRDGTVTGVQTCALPISDRHPRVAGARVSPGSAGEQTRQWRSAPGATTVMADRDDRAGRILQPGRDQLARITRRHRERRLSRPRGWRRPGAGRSHRYGATDDARRRQARFAR